MFYFREGALSEVVRKWLAAPARSPRPVKSRGELRALALAQAPLRSGEEVFDRVSQRRRDRGSRSAEKHRERGRPLVRRAIRFGCRSSGVS
jgi:hypothetical protein